MNKLRSMTEITSAINKCLKNVANNYIEVGYYLALARDEIRLHPHTYNNRISSTRGAVNQTLRKSSTH